MKNKIPTYLKERLNVKSTFPKFYPAEMKQFILDYGQFYNYPNDKNLTGDKLLSLWFRFMKNNIAELGICGYDGCENNNQIVNDSKTNGFLISKGCCSGHSVKIVMLEKHGVENAMHLEQSKEKIKNTLLKNHGVENPMYSSEIRKKHKNIMIAEYGVDNIFKNGDYIKSKFKEKYGVDNPSQVAEFESRKKKTAFNKKEFYWATGEISFVQGYEPIILKELENKGYYFDDVVVSPNDVPEIWYVFEGKSHRYYPDIYIPKENLIIEVKSNWTLNKELDKNQAKFNAVKEVGFNFKLEVR